VNELSTSRTGPYQILALSGSLRAVSSNALAIEAVAALAPATLQVSIYRGLNELPHFNPDLDTDELRPLAVSHWRAALAAADALLLSSPEYAHGVPGALKNALDWVVSGFEFPALPVALLNTAPRAVHAQAALVETLKTMSAELLSPPVTDIPMAGRQFSLDQVVSDPTLAGPIRGVLNNLEAAAREVRLAGRRLVTIAGDPVAG
jgi:NAD(P)H-dependent FMN reductase